MSKIFISYRREDAAGYAISIHDQLAHRFGVNQIFMDIDDIEPGEDFVEVINEKVSVCDILLVLIGRHWLTCKDESGRHRLDNEDDFVRLEIALAIDRKIRVIPVLVGGACLPRRNELPQEITSLCNRNAIALTDTGFRQDINRLIECVEKVIAPNSRRDTVALSPTFDHTTDATCLRREPEPDDAEIAIGQERTFRDHAKPVKTIAFSPDSNIIASAGGGSWLGGGDTIIRLWRITDGRLLHKLVGHKDTVKKIVYSPAGDLLVSCCSNAIFLWRMSDCKRLRTIDHGASAIVFSRDGKTLLSWTQNLSLEYGPWVNSDLIFDVWSVADGKPVGHGTCDDLIEKTHYMWDCVSPDGRIVAVPGSVKTSEDESHDEYRIIALKSLPDESLNHECRIRNAGGIINVVFSADGKYLASDEFSSPVIRLWRVSDGKLLAKVRWPETSFGSNNANSLAFSPNGKWLAAGTEDDKLVRIWPLLRTSQDGDAIPL